MTDYIGKNQKFELMIEQRQDQVRKKLIESYIACRKKKKLTQADVANMLGIARPNITRFENGEYNPTLDMLVKIAGCIGMELRIELVYSMDSIVMNRQI